MRTCRGPSLSHHTQGCPGLERLDPRGLPRRSARYRRMSVDAFDPAYKPPASGIEVSGIALPRSRWAPSMPSPMRSTPIRFSSSQAGTRHPQPGLGRGRSLMLRRPQSVAGARGRRQADENPNKLLPHLKARRLSCVNCQIGPFSCALLAVPHPGANDDRPGDPTPTPTTRLVSSPPKIGHRIDAGCACSTDLQRFHGSQYLQAH